jgi:hypothetical protein
MPYGISVVEVIAAVGFVGICYLAIKFGQWLRGDLPARR